MNRNFTSLLTPAALSERLRRIARNGFSAFSKLFVLQNWKNSWQVYRGKKVAAYWFRGSNDKNWGDKINPVLMQLLSGKEIVHCDDMIRFRFLRVHTCMGSIVEHLRFRSVNIWGVGLISARSVIKIKPSSIHSVRGPKTRARLAEAGYEVPEIYGDPALLLPLFYESRQQKKHELGIIPHYVDKNSAVIRKLEEEGAYIIDVFGDEFGFIDEVNRCKHIASSSLHGLIVADAYGIPSKWLRISDKIFGDTFKYDDYYESLGCRDETPLQVTGTVSKEQIKNACSLKKIPIDLTSLLESCPYYSTGAKPLKRAFD